MDEINALRTMLEAERILDGCTETRGAVAQCCRFFRQSGCFDRAISSEKIDIYFALARRTE
jgi:hypothetical protein